MINEILNTTYTNEEKIVLLMEKRKEILNENNSLNVIFMMTNETLLNKIEEAVDELAQACEDSFLNEIRNTYLN